MTLTDVGVDVGVLVGVDVGVDVGVFNTSKVAKFTKCVSENSSSKTVVSALYHLPRLVLMLAY